MEKAAKAAFRFAVRYKKIARLIELQPPHRI